MHLSSLALTALLPIQLFLPTSAPAQTASNEMATGDVWPSQEELIYLPREALEVPDAVSLGDIKIATGDVWPSPRSRSRKKLWHQPPWMPAHLRQHPADSVAYRGVGMARSTAHSITRYVECRERAGREDPSTTTAIDSQSALISLVGIRARHADRREPPAPARSGGLRTSLLVAVGAATFIDIGMHLNGNAGGASSPSGTPRLSAAVRSASARDCMQAPIKTGSQGNSSPAPASSQ